MMTSEARIGVVGLGTMGAALALNIADHGFRVAIWNRNPDRVADLRKRAGALVDQLVPVNDLKALVAALRPPRAILLMVKAGQPVREMIAQLQPLLSVGDILIDAGNADFHDTRANETALRASGVLFVGMGVSGGEEGARHGPSIMVGGDQKAYAPIADIVEAIAARYDGVPCAAHLGSDGAGHFVKTVHNGIEYADMELIAEVYGLMRHGQGKPPEEIGLQFDAWNRGPLQSYLVEITSKILATKDPATDAPIVDVILDRAGQKGTGRWTLIEALKLGQSASTIEAAVAARSWSAAKQLRETGEITLQVPDGPAPDLSAEELGQALLSARVLAYGQGMALLQTASETYEWQLDLARVAEIWRAGCIIRSALLNDIATAVRDGLPQGAMHLAPAFAKTLQDGLPALRKLVAQAALTGLPVPGFAAALAYVETMRRGRGTTDLIQAQRDFFGAHGFERIDQPGAHHGPWGASPT